MKRTAIRRYTPLKAKTRLRPRSKRKAGEWAKYDKFMLPYKSMDCAVCLVMKQANCGSVCGHHLITKGSQPRYRMEPKNIIPLCIRCHSWAHGVVAPDDKFRSKQTLLDWMKIHRPEQYQWAMENRGK